MEGVGLVTGFQFFTCLAAVFAEESFEISHQMLFLASTYSQVYWKCPGLAQRNAMPYIWISKNKIVATYCRLRRLDKNATKIKAASITLR